MISAFVCPFFFDRVPSWSSASSVCGPLCIAVKCLWSSGVKQIINAEKEPLKSRLEGDD